jgi:hypothetical protein
VITTQGDADLLSQCGISAQEIKGNVTISKDASGHLNLINFGVIKGSLTASDNSNLASLFLDHGASKQLASGHWRKVNKIIIRNLSSFTSFSAPSVDLGSGELTFENLPKLEMIDIREDQNFYSIQLSRLPNLKQIAGNRLGWFSASQSIILKDLGSSSIGNFFNWGYSAKNIVAKGIPNVNDLVYRVSRAKKVTVSGNGNLSLVFDCTGCNAFTNILREETIDSLSVSGLSFLTRNRTIGGHVHNLTIGTFTARGNSFTTLPLDFTNLTSLYIEDNTNLTTIVVNSNFSHYNWQDIVIKGNPKLRLTSNSAANSFDPKSYKDVLVSYFVWPTVDLSTMVLEGAFGNDFL